MLGAEADVSVAGEVEHEVAIAHRGGEPIEIEHVSLDQREVIVGLRCFDEFALAS